MKPKEVFNQGKNEQEQSDKDKGVAQTDKDKGVAQKPDQEKQRQHLLDEDKAVPNPVFPHSTDEEEEGPKPLKLKPDEGSGSKK